MFRNWIALALRPPAAGPEQSELEEVSETNPVPMRMVRNDLDANVHHRTYQIAIGTTANLVLTANPKRRRAVITQITGTQIAYLGTKIPLVAAANGDYFSAAAGVKWETRSQDEIWGIAAVAQQTVSVYEEYVD